VSGFAHDAQVAPQQARVQESAMLAIVVFESLYGNTEAVARRVAAGLRGHGFDVELRRNTDLAPDAAAAADLLVVGGPTHVHSLSWTVTRQAAARDADNPAAAVGPGLREWLRRLPRVTGPRAAAFGTRLDRPVRYVGSAGRTIGRRLERRGFTLIAPPEGFLVSDGNHLLADELEHADRWAGALAETMGQVRV
jgi:hypothetical protein